MNWTSPITVTTIHRRGRNHRNVLFDPMTKRFIQVKPAEKPPPIVLTLDDKERLIKEFRGIFNREPDGEEIEVLLTEELKLKQARAVTGVNSPVAVAGGNGKPCPLGVGELGRTCLPLQ